MDWKELVGSVAPVLGGSLGGPFGAMAGKWLAGKLGVEEDQLEETVATASPETMLAIRQLDNDFKVEMKRLGLEEKQLHADDRQSARKMAMDTTLLPQIIISTIFIIIFGLIMQEVFSASTGFSDTQKGIIMYMLGILSAGIIQIMNFWFGSSSGSKEKTAKLKI